MTVRLVVRQRGEAGGNDKTNELLLEEALITLGRDAECQVMLPQRAVSRTHAQITQDGALYFVEDLGSAYGTQINDEPLPRGEKRLLRNGDVIAIAQFDIEFERVSGMPKGDGQSEKTAFVARQAVKDVMRGIGGPGEGPFFRIMNGPREGERIEVEDAQEIVFGREEGADVILQDNLVSRRHAKVRRDWSGTHVEDLESRNGIRVNKKRVMRRTLKDKDELEVGSVRMLYLDPSAVSDERPAGGGEPSELSNAARTNHDNQIVEEPPLNPILSDAPDGEDESAAEEASEASESHGESGLEGSEADEGSAASGMSESGLGEDGGFSGQDSLAEPEAEEPKKNPFQDPEQRKKIIALAFIGLIALVALIIVVLVLVGV